MHKGMPDFRLKKTAESDIASIADYIIYKFGIGQARKYRNELLDTFGHLASNPSLGRIFVIEGQASLKRYRHKAHMIFYKETDLGILVVRILGGRMDFKRHL